MSNILDTIPAIPANLKMSDLKWKFLVRNILRSKNLLMTGPTGSGKTVAAIRAAALLGRPFFNISMGSSQDPRATLIGNTHYDPTKGTNFNESTFIKAIQTPNAVILLDEYQELTRRQVIYYCHPPIHLNGSFD